MSCRVGEHPVALKARGLLDRPVEPGDDNERQKKSWYQRVRKKFAMLEIKNLHVTVDGREILKGLDLKLPKGEVHAIMGPNGSGKSTLAYVLAGKQGYEVTAGSIHWNGEDLLAMDPAERAAAGVFLAFQYPMEIPGVATMTFLRTATNAVRKARGEPELSTPDFLQPGEREGEALKIDPEMLKRPLNVGFSGGEKKRNEILQMALLDPVALRARRDRFRPRHRRACASSPTASTRSASKERSMLVITHYQRLLDYIVPDRVHVLSDGRIARSGGPELALELESPATPNSAARRPRSGSGTRWSCPVQQFQHQGRAGLSRLFMPRRSRRFPARAIHWSPTLRGERSRLMPARAAAPPHRGLEIYRPPRDAHRSLSA